MLLLFETPAGFALFKVLNEGKLANVEDLWKEFSTSDSARKIVKLSAFSKFKDTTEALAATTLIVESKLSKSLKKFIKKECQNETLAVADSKLGSIIKEKLGVSCVHNSAVLELMRGVRSQLAELITGLGQDMAPMSLGLSHSLSRYKLKFSPDKVDTMIIQAIGLLDDLDKELNTYAMRVREWYGWHFPELAKIIQDNIQYAKSVKLMGSREKAAALDFSGILEEEVESELKEAAVISMGTEVSETDMMNIKALCDQVIALSSYRAQLYDYLKSRMNAIAPNLTVLVGELVGARLISHAGSLINLAKHPASTVQILGAEKALFRALKTKHETPKYGLIYHASLIGQAAPKFKGKISRVLAAKCALAIRMDALGEGQEATVGLEGRMKVESRLRQFEGRALGKLSGAAKGKPNFEAYDRDRKPGTPGMLTGPKAYNAVADTTVGVKSGNGGEVSKKRKKEKAGPVKEEEEEEQAADEEPSAKKKKKDKKKKVQFAGEEETEDRGEETPASGMDVEKKKKKKKRDLEDAEQEVEGDEGTPAVEEGKKKKKKTERYFEGGAVAEADGSAKKKSKLQLQSDDVAAAEGTPAKKYKVKAEDSETPLANNGSMEKKKKKKTKSPA